MQQYTLRYIPKSGVWGFLRNMPGHRETFILRGLRLEVVARDSLIPCLNHPRIIMGALPKAYTLWKPLQKLLNSLQLLLAEVWGSSRKRTKGVLGYK